MDLKSHQYYFFIIPVIASILALGAIFTFGLKPGIDLVGGSILQITYPESDPDVSAIRAVVEPLAFGEVRVQEANEKDFVLRQRDLTTEEKTMLMSALNTLGSVEEIQFNSIGPSIGAELVRKAWWAIGLVTFSIIIFIAFAFRGVSKPVASWKYGVVAIITLIHDILIPTGLFALLGYTHGAEVGVFFIVALLTTLGISINDTIVVFDRIRENLRLNEEKKRLEIFADVVWRSVVQTLARSINTSLTVLVVLGALFMFGPESTRDFSLTLIVGMIAGTYSSILLASPLLVLIEKHQKKPQK